ncbi:uncharacterized protein LTR77_006333 [Saxophila tyrrhenica]|uniref:DUF300-domain-containing protein n=1 Tax=Saxophila tyrrhenica TaxID=1690608 RepID=A0AAV9PAL4_9PEZI|nr:hypothetical protein LTR77_006333 [Saxophila tyrrhenica]
MAKHDCPVPKGAENYGKRGTSWHPMLYLSLACLGATTAISISLIFQHLRRYRAPKEQRQIIRIIFSVVAYSLVAFFELFQYEDAEYLDPLGDVYEAFGLCALFLLFIQYASPNGTFDEATFDAVKSGEDIATTFNWPKIAWIFVFQYVIVEVLCVGVQEATQAAGVFCMNSLSPQFTHLWIEIIESISIGACVLAIVKFYQRMKTTMKAKRGLSKIAMFKGIVFIRFVQQWVFSLLLQHDVIKPGPAFSYNDILYGIPATATCAEMVLFSLGFWYSFSSSEYSSTAKPHVRPLPMWKAVLDALNPTDFVLGVVRIFPLCMQVRKTGDWSAYRASTKKQGLAGAIRKGRNRYKNRGQDRYQELDQGTQNLTRPTESHQSQDFGRPSMSGGLGGQCVYQPPGASPPGDEGSYLTGGLDGSGHRRAASQQYLMADHASPGRPRASSQSSLMAESQPPPGYFKPGQRYDRSRSPSPSPFAGAPMGGREMI